MTYHFENVDIVVHENTKKR